MSDRPLVLRFTSAPDDINALAAFSALCRAAMDNGVSPSLSLALTLAPLSISIGHHPFTIPLGSIVK